ncbi:glycine dehydrogenase (aminomethyl-transferring), partial [Streptosporangium sandarakinum]
MTDLSPLGELSSPPFSTRHIGPADDDQARMLETVGFASAADLLAVAVPEAIRTADRLDLPPAASEPEAIAELRALASRNTVLTSMIGLGYHDTITPAVIRRNLLENPGWYTAYTPYQPEI